MTSFEPAIAGRRAWLGPVLVTIAVLAFAVTVASFLWSMRGNLPASTSDPEYVEPDPQVLDEFVAPEGFKAVGDSPACGTSEISRCYRTDLSRPRVMEAVEPWIGGAGVTQRESPFGYSVSFWCGNLDGDAAYFSVTPNVTNARRLSPGSWRFPDDPEIDGQLMLGIVLAESRTCD